MGRESGHFNQLREARIILPFLTQNGQPIPPDTKAWLEDELVGKFGGFTGIVGFGICTMRNGSPKQEAVYVYDVAMPERDYPKLILIGLKLLTKADQETVYLRDCYGRVFIGANAAELCAEIG